MIKINSLIIPFIFLTSVAHSNDPLFDQQWSLKNNGLPQVIDLDPVRNFRSPGVKGQDIGLNNRVYSKVPSPRQVLVAVLDTGIDRSHPDLVDMIRVKPKECEALAQYLKCKSESDNSKCDAQWLDPKNPDADTDGNGYPMDCYGWSAMGIKNEVNGIIGSPLLIDTIGHGTHVAGLIGAQVGNGIGIEGVSSHVKLLPIQVVAEEIAEPLKPMSVDLSPNEENREKNGYKLDQDVSDRVARGFIYALSEGAEVINLSLGWPQVADSKLLRELVAEAIKRGVIVVAAAGNDATRALLRPCSYPGVLCVGALSPDGGIAHFSNYGSGVDIAAPGLNILSTYPEEKRPARFRSTLGYEFLSGTSQAAPIVSGIVAEMLAAGIPSNEIYARLVLSARKVLENKTMFETYASGEKHTLKASIDPLEKFIFSGQADLSKALTVPFRAVIAPAIKERPEILWNGESSQFTLDIAMENRGASINAAEVEIKAFIKAPNGGVIRPQVTKIEQIPLAQKPVWVQGEKRNYRVSLAVDPARRHEIPADLDLAMVAQYSNGYTQTSIVEPEVTIPLSKIENQDKVSFEIKNLPKGRWDWNPFESVDNSERGTAYLITEQAPQGFRVAVLNIKDGKTELKGPVILPGTQGLKLMAVMWSVQTPAGYVFGVIEEGEPDAKGPSATYYFDLDFNLKIKSKSRYDSKFVQIPFNVKWLKLKENIYRPAWIGGGLDPNKKPTLWERWENRNTIEKVQQRLYWLNEEFKPQALAEIEGGQKFVDFVSGPKDADGVLTALTVKSKGVEAQPDYIQSASFVTFADGKVVHILKADQDLYRSLLDAKRIPLYNLDSNTPAVRGMAWFAEGALQTQKITTWDMMKNKFQNYDARALREHFDSALWTQAVFEGEKMSGSFVVTNSEVQYHDLRTGKAVRKSLERYTFFSDSLQILLAYPLVIQSKNGPTKLIPALFASENVDFERGVKLVVPIFAKNGDVVELVSPSTLNIKADKGCKPFKTPIQMESGETALDFYCAAEVKEGEAQSTTKEQIIRVYLRY
jgi:subtilisin family serine protease